METEKGQTKTKRKRAAQPGLRKSSKPPKRDAPEITKVASKELPEPLPWYALLVFNSVIIAGIALSMQLARAFSNPCVPVLASAFCAALILVMLWHLVWRYLHAVLRNARGTLRLLVVRLRLEGLFATADALHLRLSTPWLWAMSLTLLLLATFVCCSPASPLRRSEMPPSVKVFHLRYADGKELAVKPGGLAEVPVGDSVRIEAEVRESDGDSCQWSAARGEIHGAGCAALYQAPFDGFQDTLSTVVKSVCQTQDGLAGLTVKVTGHRPDRPPRR